MTVIQAVLRGILTLFVASVFIWSLVLLAPGDPADRVLNARGILEPHPSQVTQVREELGLAGQPHERYLEWVGSAVRGNFGASWVTGRPVAEEFFQRLPASARLTVAAIVIPLVFALALALLSALFRDRWPDAVSRGVSVLLNVVPSFIIGVALLDIVVVRLGQGQVMADGTWGTVLLPALALSAGPAAVWSRILRASLLEANGSAFVRLSRARGATRLRQVVSHGIRNALTPFLTVIGVGVAGLLGGAPIIESVFSWPGVGLYTVEAIVARDLPVIQTFVLFAAILFIGVSILVDLLVRRIDPRVAPSRGGMQRRRAVLRQLDENRGVR